MAEPQTQEALRGPARAHYRMASESHANYLNACAYVADAMQLSPSDAVLLAYQSALDGVGALYTLLPFEQFARVNKALHLLNDATLIHADTATALEIRLIRAAFCEGLPVVFLQEGIVRQDAKVMLKLLEEEARDLPSDLATLVIRFLQHKVRLSFLDADRLLDIQRKLAITS
jgi:hypothetical protein